MKSSRLWRGIRVLGTAALVLAAGTAGNAAGQSPPWITIPVSAASAGQVITVTFGSFVPDSVVILKVTAPGGAGEWSRTLGIAADGSATYPVEFTEAGFYRLDVLDQGGQPLTMLMVSSVRQQ